MTLSEILTGVQLQVDDDGADKWAVLDRLVDLLASGDDGINRSAVLEAVMKRERQRSTGLENGIAIPHAWCAELPRVMGVMGTSNNGMDFESLDGKPCHLVFLIVAPPRDSSHYLKTLSAVTAIGANAERADRLRSANNSEEVFNVLSEISVPWV